VAAGATLEVDFRAALEFLLRHDRIVGVAARNLDLDFRERRHRRLIGGGGPVAVFLRFFLRERGAREDGERQRGAAQQRAPGVGGSDCHDCLRQLVRHGSICPRAPEYSLTSVKEGAPIAAHPAGNPPEPSECAVSPRS